MFAARTMFLDHARVLQRHFPTAEGNHARAEGTMLCIERTVAHGVRLGGLRSRAGFDGFTPTRVENERRTVGGRIRVDELRPWLQPVLDQQMEIVALIKD